EPAVGGEQGGVPERIPAVGPRGTRAVAEQDEEWEPIRGAGRPLEEDLEGVAGRAAHPELLRPGQPEGRERRTEAGEPPRVTPVPGDAVQLGRLPRGGADEDHPVVP